MKHNTVSTCILIVCLSLVMLPFIAASDEREEAMPKSTEILKEKQPNEPDPKKQKELSGKAEAKKSEFSVTMNIPVYRPPMRGAPNGRVGGGTRGGNGETLPSLCVLAPDHIGLTVQEQPALYWFLSELTTHPIEFTLIEYQAIKPIIETQISSPEQPGVQCVRLSEYGIRLQQGVLYRWFVALVPSSESRSKDIVAGGTIECIEMSEALSVELASEAKEKRPHIYAQAGLWYDAFSEISNIIENTPNDTNFKKQRASLLEQVELPEIARYDMKKSDVH